MKKYKGVIFDLDGTLIDTIEDLTDSLNIVLEKHDLPPISYLDGRHYIGNGLRKLIERSVAEPYKSDDDFLDQALAEMKEEYQKRWTLKSRPYPGVEAFLTFCQNHQIPLAVSSNKTDEGTKHIIQALFPDIEFMAAEGEKDGVPRKPDPGQTSAIIRKMGLEPEEVLYVGDSLTDVRTAENCGLDLVLVTYGYEHQDVFESFDAEKVDNLELLIDKLDTIR